jgi:hypothetical protein
MRVPFAALAHFIESWTRVGSDRSREQGRNPGTAARQWSAVLVSGPDSRALTKCGARGPTGTRPRGRLQEKRGRKGTPHAREHSLAFFSRAVDRYCPGRVRRVLVHRPMDAFSPSPERGPAPLGT